METALPITSTGTPISLENMMHITNMVSAGEAGDMSQSQQAVVTQEQITEMTEDQIISAVSMATGGMATKYYTTVADQSAAPVAMTLEEITNAIQNPSAQNSEQESQPYLILLKNQT